MVEAIERRWFFWLVLFAAFAAAAANCWTVYRFPLNGDVAWYLRAGRDILGGKKLYRDYFETNPPLICYLSVIPAWIAEVTGLPLKAVWAVISTTVLFAFAGAAARLWRMAWAASREQEVTALLFLTMIGMVDLFAIDYGQREHFGFMASLALAMALACRIQGVPLNRAFAFALSVAAGIVLAIKPFFLVPWFLCLIYAAVSAGWRTVLRAPEARIATAAAFVQIPLVALVTPGYLRFVGPLGRLYAHYDQKSFFFLMREPTMLIPAVGLILLLLYRPSRKSLATYRMAIVLAAGWIAAGALQRKGWYYQLRPGEAASCFVLWLAGMDLLRRQPADWRFARIAEPVAAVALFCVAVQRSEHVHWERPDYMTGLERLLDREPAGARVLMLSTSMFPPPLLERENIGIASRYLHLWQLPALYNDEVKAGGTNWKYRAPRQMGPDEKDMLDRTREDLATNPDLVIAGGEEQQAMGRLKVDLVKYFRQDPEFDRLFAHYRLIESSTFYKVYRLNSNAGTESRSASRDTRALCTSCTM